MLRLALAGLVLTTTALAQEPTVTSNAPGRVAGRVINDVGGPVAGAILVLTTDGGMPVANQRSDTDGRFEFASVPPGANHRLIANKPGLHQTSQQVRDERPARAFRVRPGERVEVTLTMARGGAVYGRIVDEFGEPLQGMRVGLLRYGTGGDGRRALMPAGEGDVTDDRGEFRAFGLSPGDYYVVATEPAGQTGSGPQLGGLFDRGPTLPNYFPGTLNVAEAEPVTVAVGVDTSVTFAWRPASSFRISGVVVSPAGLQVSSMISLGTGSSNGPAGVIGPDGGFTIANVAPGDYLLTVQTFGDAQTFPVSVADHDVSGLVLTLRPPRTIRGHIVADMPGTPPPVRTVPGDANDVLSVFRSVTIEPFPDGRFTVATSASRVFFEAMGGALVAELRVDGVDVSDTGIDLGTAASVDNVRIRVTNRAAAIGGRVIDDAGRPVLARVVAFRLDAPTLPLRMAVRSVLTDVDGRFRVGDLRRGTYAIMASEEADLSPIDQERLQHLRSAGRRVTVGEGEAATIELRPLATPR